MLLQKDRDLIEHMVDLLSAKDPLAYQAIQTATFSGVQDFDPSPEAELQRIKDRVGQDDVSVYDEYGPGDDDSDELDIIRREIGLI